MSADRTVHRWSPETPSSELAEQLEERVRRIARDRVSSARILVRELSAALKRAGPEAMLQPGG